MQFTIRAFTPADAPSLVEILKRNGQYGYPDVEGPAAMARVAACDAAVLLVAEVDGQPRGLVRGVYDGSRALIHLVSVCPDDQHGGIGRALVAAITREFVRRGAPTVSVTVTRSSAGFWAALGYRELPVFVMLDDNAGRRGSG